MSKEQVRLIYIGDNFYLESKSIMSCIYKETGERFDWGFVSVALREGKEVNIRQATKEEMKPYTEYLKELKKKFSKKDW